MNNLHIHAPKGFYQKDTRYCHRCLVFCEAVIEHSDSPYYSSVVYLQCGDIAEDGYMKRRPFERGWRKKRTEYFESISQVATKEEPIRCGKCFYITCHCEKGNKDEVS